MYNGLFLPLPDTTSFEQTAIYDPSYTDWYLVKFDVTVQCKLNVNYMSLIAPDLIVGGAPVTENAADIMAVARSRLLQPRRAFSFKCGGVELIPQPPAGNAGTVDAKNGPQPQSCSLVQLTSTLFLMTWKVVAHYWENNSVDPNEAIDPTGNPIVSNQQGNPVLYNRWTETQSIDQRNYSRRTRKGKFVIRSDNEEGLIADQLRQQMAVVGIPKGFLREKSDYTVSEDGLSITYTVTDKEVYKYPPRPAFTATGSYTESSGLDRIKYGQVDVSLQGDPDGDHDELVNVAITVATQKLRNRGARVNDDDQLNFLEIASIRVGLYDNWVEVCMRSMLDMKRGRKAGVANWDWAAAGGGAVGNTPEDPEPSLTETPLSQDFDTPPQYTLRGSSVGLLLQAAAYYDPNLKNTLIDEATNQLKDRPEVGTAGKTREP